jgi:hypothetical protein
MEGRLGVFARNLATGDVIAINADKSYPVGNLEAAFQPAAGESRAAERTPRALGERIAALHQSWRRGLDHPVRRALVANADRRLAGPGLSPTIEVGAASGDLPRSPGLAGYVSTPEADVVFCVLASGLESSFTAGATFPEVVEACFRRLVPGFVEGPRGEKPSGVLAASIHERDLDARLFPKTPAASSAEDRGGAQRLKFHPGEVARVAVMIRPLTTTRVTVQWWSPSERPEGCASQVVDGGALADVVFDQPVDKLGNWRVRAAVGNAIVLDEKFFVTPR